MAAGGNAWPWEDVRCVTLFEAQLPACLMLAGSVAAAARAGSQSLCG